MSTGKTCAFLIVAAALLAGGACGPPPSREAGSAEIEDGAPPTRATSAESAAAGAAPSDAQAPQSAWWLRVRFPPDSIGPSGGPQGLSGGWDAASLLEESDLVATISPAELQQFRASAFQLELKADVRAGGALEKVAVGTYRNPDGTSGRLLMVYENDAPVRHYTIPGEPGFSALVDVDGEIRWYQCMECGDYYLLRWSGEDYVLE